MSYQILNMVVTKLHMCKHFYSLYQVMVFYHILMNFCTKVHIPVKEVSLEIDTRGKFKDFLVDNSSIIFTQRNYNEQNKFLTEMYNRKYLHLFSIRNHQNTSFKFQRYHQSTFISVALLQNPCGFFFYFIHVLKHVKLQGAF